MADSAPVIRVLIVDDHRVFVESLARLLADESDIVVVGTASGVTEALRVSSALDPDVFLVDYVLPDGDGVHLATELRHRHPTAMVVMLTSMADDRVLLAAIDAGCAGFLTKDRAASEVVDAVRTVAAGEALVSPDLLARLLPRLSQKRQSRRFDLTDRESQLLGLMAEGGANKAIAKELNLSVNTVRNYVQSVLSKLGAHSKLEAVAIAVREGLVTYRDSG